MRPNKAELSPRSGYDDVAHDQGVVVVIWWAWGFLAIFGAMTASVLIGALLSSKKVRAYAVNLYLVALFLPDLFMSISFALVSFVNISHGGIASEGLCSYQAFYLIFCWSASLHVNGIVAYEMLMLMRATQRLQTYEQPSQRHVVIRCAVAYLWSALLGSIALWGDWLPIHPAPTIDMVCLPASMPTTQGLLIFWLLYVPLVMVLPIVGTAVLCLRTWLSVRRGMCATRFDATSEGIACSQRRKQARAIWLYFSRIYLSLILWLPSMLSTKTKSHSVVAIGISLTFLQNFVAAILSQTKPDVREATLDFLHLKRLLRKSQTTVVPCTVGTSMISERTLSRAVSQNDIQTSNSSIRCGPAGSIEEGDRHQHNTYPEYHAHAVASQRVSTFKPDSDDESTNSSQGDA